jgi:hypothetical protein
MVHSFSTLFNLPHALVERLVRLALAGVLDVRDAGSKYLQVPGRTGCAGSDPERFGDVASACSVTVAR